MVAEPLGWKEVALTASTEQDVESVDREFSRLRGEVNAYEKTWFNKMVEPQSSFLRSRPGLKLELTQAAVKGQVIFTSHVYKMQDVWHGDRAQVHSSVVQQVGPQPERGILGSAEGVYILLGLPGSGKSSTLRPMVDGHAKGVSGPPLISDADEIRVKLPEYSSGLGSAVVQPETAELAYEPMNGLFGGHDGMQGLVLSDGRVAIVDVIGDASYIPDTVKRVAGQGRRVYVMLASCPLEECVRRVKTRAVETGRYVDLGFVRSKDGAPERALRAAIDTGVLAGWAIVDTSGASPRVVTNTMEL
ncbi:hypothetical protein CVS27_01820 [Arthrobacter glacialis]|uniref:UDP-N-acetylglucosamine kinase n=1 Tax=Arthrobacter glacialis TaxID=1664 RepID=A0A2S4A1K1_ARTGL|nr:hypothetical protein CVS27_01820 [Arthrobacter glacialis]